MRVELPTGVQFAVGSGLSDAEHASPPPVGTVVTIRYQELSDVGVPRFPTYVGLRVDPDPWSAKGEVLVPTSPPLVHRFELVRDTSAKFWEVQVRGSEATVRFGRIGTEGQAQTRQFADAAAAVRFAEKSIREKTAKGYHEAT